VLGAVNQFKPREFAPNWARAAVGVLFAVLVLNAIQMVREHPLVYVEGTKNIHARQALEAQIPPVLRALIAERPGCAVLMDTSTLPNLVAFTGIPLRQTINEGDLDIYSEALAAPAAHAAIVVAFDGDEIDRAVKAHPEGLTKVRRFVTPGEPAGTIYVSDAPGASSVSNAGGAVVASGKAAIGAPSIFNTSEED